MMTIEHRKADICNQMFNQNLTGMITNLAKAAEELEKAQAKIVDLEKQLAALTPAPATAAEAAPAIPV